MRSLPEPVPIVAHRARIVEDERHLERVLQPNFGRRREVHVRRSACFADQLGEGREEKGLVFEPGRQLQRAAAGVVLRQQRRSARCWPGRPSRDWPRRSSWRRPWPDRRFAPSMMRRAVAMPAASSAFSVSCRCLRHFGVVDAERQRAHDRHDRHRRHQRVIAALVAEKPADHCLQPPAGPTAHRADFPQILKFSVCAKALKNSARGFSGG